MSHKLIYHQNSQHYKGTRGIEYQKQQARMLPFGPCTTCYCDPSTVEKVSGCYRHSSDSWHLWGRLVSRSRGFHFSRLCLGWSLETIANGDLSAKGWESLLSGLDGLKPPAVVGCEDVNLNSSQEAGIRLEIEADMAVEIADEMAEEVLESW